MTRIRIVECRPEADPTVQIPPVITVQIAPPVISEWEYHWYLRPAEIYEGPICIGGMR